MSEAPPTRGIVLCHGTLAEGLVDAVRRITDVEEGALVAMSNASLSPDELTARIREELVGGAAVVFTDLPSGSCGFAARRLCREKSDLAVISGVNLPQLIDFVMHRTLPLERLVPRLLDRGRAAITCAPPELEDHGRRAASGG